MNAKDHTTVDQMVAFLEGTQQVAFIIADDKDVRYRWVQHTLVKFHYLSLSKPDKGVLIRYLMRLSGYSRQQLTRLIKQYRVRAPTHSVGTMPVTLPAQYQAMPVRCFAAPAPTAPRHTPPRTPWPAGRN